MDAIAHILLGLTASERWAAARRMSPRSVPEQWLVLLGVAVMLVLLVVLLALSFRHRLKRQGQSAEKFDLEALRRGLTVRERQILSAIAARSGWRRRLTIFHTADAFDHGATQLLAELAQTRAPQENVKLKEEVLRLREKLGFRTPGRAPTAREHSSSRDIPVSKSIELTSAKDPAAPPMRARVLANDETELIVALQTPVPSKTGDSWLARYYAGMTAWEFRSSTVRSDGRKLVLHHTDEIRFINRRRFPRVPIHVPALMARLPLLRSEVAIAEGISPSAEGQERAGRHPLGEGGPTFVECTVTEFAGPGLRIETRLPAQVDERVLVVVPWPQGRDGAATARRTLVAVGRVKHGQNIGGGTGSPDAIDRVWEGTPHPEADALVPQPVSIAVELIGLNDEEIDAVASFADELPSLALDGGVHRTMEPQETPTYTTAT